MNPYSIAACLITKNSEATLERALASIRPFVDHVFVYDTGSTDGTLDLIARLNEQPPLVVDNATGRVLDPGELAEATPGEPPATTIVPLAPIVVEQGEWRDDFAWAREQSFRMATEHGPYPWLLWLDDDDEIVGAQMLRQLAARAHPTVDGFAVFYDYARDEAGRCVCQLWRERLIRADRGFRWTNAVHEVLVLDGRGPNYELVPANVLRYVHHRPDGRYPGDRNLRILEAAAQAAEERGEEPDPRTLAYLGTEQMAHGNLQASIGYLERYLRHPEATNPDERAQIHHKLAMCLRAGGFVHEAIEVEMAALKARVDWAESFAGLMECYATLGDPAKTEFWARRVLDAGMPQSMLILNPIEFTLLPALRISEVCTKTGRFDEAEQWIARAHEFAPGHPHVVQQAQSIQVAKADRQMIDAILLLRETLVRHDENAKALHLLENVPYRVADRPEIVLARAAQREMCAHMIDPAEYERWYVEEPKESTVPDDFVPRAGEVFHRVGVLEQGLQEQERELGRKPRLLDAGCNDFWMGAYFVGKGYEVDGIELNRRAYEIALERAKRFGAGDSTIVHGNLHDAPDLLGEGVYDAVSMFEVLEHVPDIDATLTVLERMLAPGGRIYLSTPDGAYEKGNLQYWAVVEPKGHLRALPAHEFLDVLDRRGDVHQFDLGQGLSVASYTPREKTGHVVFYAGACIEPWNPQDGPSRGLGGSETMLVRVATQFADAGYRVTVYADTDQAFTWPGVLWRHYTAWDPTERCDLLVVSRRPDVLDNRVGARTVALWCHDHSYPGALTEERAGKLDHVVVLSEWQRDRFARLYPFLADKLRVIRNAIALTEPGTGEPRYPHAGRSFKERKPRVVYSSSADRGLDVMLELWPRIRERVPDAELHVFYGWEVFDRAALMQPQLVAFKARVLQLVEEAGGEQGGVFMRGRVGQNELRDEMQEARVWGYPTAFLETSCISAMEARAAGLAIVTSGLGALRETVGGGGRLIPWADDETEATNRTGWYADSFVEIVSLALAHETTWRTLHDRALDPLVVDQLDWTERTPEWLALVEAHDRDLAPTT